MELDAWFEILPDVILYIASGYLFTVIFNFVSLRKTMEDVKSIFLVSLTVGFILKACLCAVVKVRINYYVNIIGFLAFSMTLAMILGFLFKSKLCRNILRKFNINRSVNNNILYDIIDNKKSMWILIRNWKKNQMILGILVSVEEFQREPQIVLQQYQVLDLEGRVLKDYMGKPERHILIKTQKFDSIDIIYDKDSKQYTNIKIKENTKGNTDD